MLLFPFYWMALTAIKPDEQLHRHEQLQSVLDVVADPQAHRQAAVRDAIIRAGCWNTMYVPVAATFVSLVASVLAAYAIVRLRFRGAQFVGGLIFLAYLVPPSILFIPLATYLAVRPVRLADGAGADLSDHPDPVLDLAADGLFQDHSVRARGMRADRRREPLADPDQDHPAARRARPDLGRHLLAHAVLERIHLRADLHFRRPQNKTVPVAIVNEFVDGDIYRWGSLMAGALVGSLPLVILYSFFVEYYVSAMTGAVKE